MWIHRCPHASWSAFQLQEDCPLCATREEDEPHVQRFLSRVRAVCSIRLDSEMAGRPLLTPGGRRWVKRKKEEH